MDKITKEFKVLVKKAYRWRVLCSKIRKIKRSEHLVRKEMAEILLFFSKKRVLNPRDYKVLKMRFIERRTFEEVGKVFGVTRERIRQIEAKSLEKIRGYCIKF